MIRKTTKRRKPIKPMKFPHSHEASYRRTLLRLSNELKLSLKRNLVPIIPKVTQEVSDHLTLPHGVMIRHDAWDDDLRIVFEKITREMISPQRNAVKDMLSLGPRIDRFNKEEWTKLIRSQYGVDPTKEDPKRFDQLLSVWAKNNALLIQDIPRKTMNQIKDATIETLRLGRSVDDMTSEIYDIMSERTDVTDSRAKLIARDQVAKLNGNLTQQRQRDIGVDSYTWRTVGDERVRETHEEVDGQVFSWDSPPSETDDNHPGEDYQCRCWAEPVLPEYLDFQASLLDEEVDA
jgi:SPP1 gp7 family putative phage head morphogenesis protein